MNVTKANELPGKVLISRGLPELSDVRTHHRVRIVHSLVSEQHLAKRKMLTWKRSQSACCFTMASDAEPEIPSVTAMILRL